MVNSMSRCSQSLRTKDLEKSLCLIQAYETHQTFFKGGRRLAHHRSVSFV